MLLAAFIFVLSALLQMCSNTDNFEAKDGMDQGLALNQWA